MNRIAFVVAVMITSAMSQAQVIYEPVQYQYSDGRNSFFYGGDDPALVDAGYRNLALQRALADVGRPEVGGAVYSDLVGWRDARIFGLNATTAYNDAHAAQPRHFRKTDLLDSAVLTPQGVVVPANAPAVRPVDARGTIIIRRSTAPQLPPPASRPIIVIPKSLFEDDAPAPLSEFDISVR